MVDPIADLMEMLEAVSEVEHTTPIRLLMRLASMIHEMERERRGKPAPERDHSYDDDEHQGTPPCDQMNFAVNPHMSPTQAIVKHEFCGRDQVTKATLPEDPADILRRHNITPPAAPVPEPAMEQATGRFKEVTFDARGNCPSGEESQR